MNSATTTLVSGSETVTFTMSETSKVISYKNSRGEFGSMSRKAALAEMTTLRAQGWTPGR